MSFFNLEKYRNAKLLTKSDFLIGSGLSIVMLILFVWGSSGMSLVATFVPGLIFAWYLFAFIYFNKIELPDYNIFLPVYFLTLGWQFVHFAEEFITNFKELFPLMYGGLPYSENSFVIFNMFSYLMFIVSPVLVYFRGLKFLFIPALFFIVYGAMGNAIAHSWWSIYFGQYFSGLYTSLVYWILGTVLVTIVFRSKQRSFTYILAFTGVLIATLTLLMK
ncbi:hypothetical protein [Gynurincola endophyticus]|uniref:hypothetical protein n=1 Tax=Gynurincola endophyticus TaxID=2479004 RepID=UPI000F8E82F1|nr:hypothetical protein [Gynurincola endophyticus]